MQILIKQKFLLWFVVLAIFVLSNEKQDDLILRFVENLKYTIPECKWNTGFLSFPDLVIYNTLDLTKKLITEHRLIINGKI